MTDGPQPDERRRSPSPSKTRTTKIRVLPPDVVPMSKQDEAQAVTAIAALIAVWWQAHHHGPTP
jgi:hypothetical protein